MNTERITHLLYYGTKEEIAGFLKSCTSEEELCTFAYNYNWENGFAVPKMILENPICSLEVALIVFYSGDGFTFLTENTSTAVPNDEWSGFMRFLYNDIIRQRYPSGLTAFRVPLTKVQIYKLKKNENVNQVFITDIPGIDCYRTL